jgi:HK97 family phage major capsid protein
MPKTITSEDLIELVQDNHKVVIENHAKLETELAETKTSLQEIQQKVSRRPGGGTGGDDELKSMGAQVIESEEFKTFAAGGGRTPTRVEVKAVGTIGSGALLAGPMIAPDTRTDPVVLPRRRMTVRQLLAPGTTEGNTVYFPKMTVRYGNAAVVAESAAKAQSGFDMVQANVPVRTIAHWIQASRNAIDDAPSLRSLIDSELVYGLQLNEEAEFISGDGTGQHILGIVPQATAYSAPFVVTGEQALDRIALGILQAELALLPADGICLNPTDWMKCLLLKNAQGEYILGKPNSLAQPRLWGLPVVPCFAITAGNFLVGAFGTAAQLYDRMAIEVLLSTEHNVNFTTNEVTIRGEERVAMAVKRPAAFIYGALP